MKVARLTDLCTGHLYPAGDTLVLISVRGEIDFRAIIRLKGLIK
jgi:hypothetical protein